MMIAYIAALLAGLTLAVRVMVAGVLKPLPLGALPEFAIARRARYSPSLFAAGLTSFGVVGAALVRLGAPGGAARLALACAAAAAAVSVASLLLKWWALSPVAPADPEDDPRFSLQGLPARITRAVVGDVPGEVTFRADGQPHVLPARAIDGGELAAGTEVVLDRIEGGMAWVEAWTQVEARL